MAYALFRMNRAQRESVQTTFPAVERIFYLEDHNESVVTAFRAKLSG